MDSQMDYYEEYSDYSESLVESDYFYSESEETYDILNDCIYPTLLDAINSFLAPILVSNLILRVLTLYVEKDFIKRLLTIGTGLSLLLYHLCDDYKLVVMSTLYICIGASVSVLGPKHKRIVWTVCIGIVCLNESMVVLNESFIRLRSHLMLNVMKIISFNALICGQSDKGHEMPICNHFVSSLSYLLHPLSLLLGVWHPFKVDKTNKSFIVCLFECIYSLLVSLVFLLLSTCLIHYYIGQKLMLLIVSCLGAVMPNSFVYFFEILLTVYITAQQFRFSHYFICFATQSQLQLWRSDLRVTNPLSIEFSRSLVDVVIAWNIPMHLWLKTHVFNPSNQKYQLFRAIFITYFVSSFLHGFNFQIWSVLLSLGILTKLEYELRKELSIIFDSCIHVRRCVYKTVETDRQNHSTSRWNIFRPKSTAKVCISKWKHKNTPYNCKWVSIVNLLFSLLAISHLSYLGSTFDGKQESSHVINVLTIWKELKFFSHITAIITFIFYKII